MDWGVNEWVAVGSALLAVVSLVLNYAVVARQTRLQMETLKVELDREVIAWAESAIAALSRAAGLARGRGGLYGPEEFQRLTYETEIELSAMTDRGRLFFPNESPHLVGQHKEAAFQGVRPPVLDALVFACCQLQRLMSESGGPDAAAAEFLVNCRRLVASEAQNAIDPRRRSQVLRQLAAGRADDAVSSFEVAYRLGMEFDARCPGSPIIQSWIETQRQFRAPRP